MLENYVGADRFRDGVRNYIKAHAYGNTVTDDLWRELDKTATMPVTPVAHDFTLQAGVPMIRATPNAKGLRLTQERYTVDDSGKAPTSWRVPVAETTLGGPVTWHGLVSRRKPAEVAVAQTAVPIVNVGQAGYFRTLYAPAAFEKLAAQFHALTPIDQLGLLNDSRSLGYSGDEPLSDFLALASAVTPDMDTYVQDNVAQRLDGIDSLYEGLPGQAAFQAYGRRVLAPIFAKVGWTSVPGESQNTTLLRASLLDALSDLDDPAVIAEARRRFAAFVADPATLSTDLRRSVLEIVATHADEATWEQIHTLAKNAKSSLEKRELYVLLGSVHNRDLANRALQLALSDEPPLTVRPSILDAVSDHYPELAVAFASDHVDVFNKILEPDSRSQFVPRLASPSHDTAILAPLRTYANAHIPADAQGDVVKAEATVTFNAKVRTQRLPDIDRWLAAHPR
jgi:aminopeptidase N